MCTLLYSSKEHEELAGQAHIEEFGEGIVSKLVRDKAKNTGSITVEEVENQYMLLQFAPGGKRVGAQNLPKNLVHKMRQRLTRFLVADRICMPYMELEANRVSTVAASWPRRLRRFPPKPTQPLGYDRDWLLGHGVLDALIDQETNPTNQLRRKLDALVGRRRKKFEVPVAVAKVENIDRSTSLADWGQGSTSVTTEPVRAETTAKEG